MGLACVAAALLVLLVVLRGTDRIYRIGQRFPRPSGYSINMTYLPPVVAPCYLIRVTADSCPYCQADQIEYRRLVESAKDAGCQVTAIGPKVGDVAPREESGIIQLQYIDMPFGLALNPHATPQTIILDDAVRLRWHCQGALQEHCVNQAVREIAWLQ